MLDRNFAIQYFQRYWAENKAKGLLAELYLSEYLMKQNQKILRTGAWLLSPKLADSHKYRFAFFIHSSCAPENSVEKIMQDVASDYLYSRIAFFLREAGVETLYAIPVSGVQKIEKNDDDMRLQWNFFRLFDGKYESVDDTFFYSWRGRGRVSHPQRRMSEDTINNYQKLGNKELSLLFLNEAFYTSYLKRNLKVPVNDPYDVDGFIVSYSGSVFPIEVKEKSPGGEGNSQFFGIDVGRIIMLLHLCLPNDSNALYIVREVDDSPRRKFIGWRYITLSDLIMVAGWGGQAGGTGMGGGTTQTILMPYQSFGDFTSETLSMDSLNSIQSLTADAKTRAEKFLNAIGQRYFPRKP